MRLRGGRALGFVVLLAASVPGAAPPRALVDAHGDPLPPSALARYGTSRLYHDGAVQLAFTHGDTRLVSFSLTPRMELRLWDAATGRLLRQRLLPPSKSKNLPILSPDGGIVFVERDGVYRLADLDAPLTRIDSGKTRYSRQGVISPDGKLLALGSAEGGVVLDLPGGEVRLRMEAKSKSEKKPKKGGPPGSTEFAFSRDGQLLACGNTRGEISVWDIAARRQLFAVTQPATKARRNSSRGDIEGGGLAFSPDGRRLLVTESQRLRLLDAETGQDAADFLPPLVNPRLARFSADGKQLLVFDLRQLHRFDAATGRALATTQFPFLAQRSIQAPTFSPERGRAAVIQVGVLRVVDLRTSESAHPALGHRGSMHKPRWPRGDEVVCLVAPPVLSVDRWNSRTGKAISSRAVGNDHHVFDFDLSRDGSLAVMWRDGETPTVRRLADGKTLWSVALGEASASARFTPDGRWVVVGRDGMVLLRDALTGKPRPGGRVNADPDEAPLAWSDCGRMYATIDFAVVKVHEFAGGSVRWSFPATLATYARFSPDGTRLAITRADGVIQVFRLGRAEPLFEVVLPRHLTREGGEVAPMTAPLFSPGGEYFAAVCNREVRIWDGDGRLVGVCRGHQGQVYDMAFSPDGRRLVTASEDGTCLVWDVRALGR